MFKWYTFKGWNKPKSQRELFERLEKADPRSAATLSLVIKLMPFQGVLLGFTFGILSSRFDYLEFLIQYLPAQIIFSFLLYGAVGVLLFTPFFIWLMKQVAYKRLQYEEYKVSKA